MHHHTAHHEHKPPYSRHRPFDPESFFGSEGFEVQSEILSTLSEKTKGEIRSILEIFSDPRRDVDRCDARKRVIAMSCENESLAMRRQIALMLIASIDTIRKELGEKLVPRQVEAPNNIRECMQYLSKKGRELLAQSQNVDDASGNI